MANLRSRRRRRRPPKNGGSILPKVLIALLAVGGLLVIGAAAVAVGVSYNTYQKYASDLQTPEERIRDTVSLGGAWLYDRNGTLLYQYADPESGLRDPVRIDEIAATVINATVSTEDASFYDNPGVNVRGLFRAAAENLLPGDFEFFVGSGGSSITQQLVKNLYIEHDERYKRSIPRKLKETVIALELTRKYDKDQILEWYLNQIFYGNNSYGVGAAARRYFGKSASELNLAEAAMLAGIPASPNAYDPIGNPLAAKSRQEDVLDLMVKHEFITQEEAEAAKAEELRFRTDDSLLLAPHWVFHLWNPETEQGVLMEMCQADLFHPPRGVDCLKLLKEGGLRVTTTLDLELQNTAEGILRSWVARYEELSGGHNGALMTIDVRTGEVLVYVGSRDYFNPDILGKNDMIRAANSPGSSFKPFTYLTAFMQGWAPASIIWDTPVTLKGGDNQVFQPTNPSGDYKGPITARTALGASLNVPAVKVMAEVGVGPVIDQARRMGITTLRDKNRYGPALTVGGGEVSLNDMVFGFSAFANNGLQHGVPAYLDDKPEWWPALQPVAVLKVTSGDGDVLYEFDGPEERRVAPAAESYLITDILSDDKARSSTFGYGSSLNLPGRTSAVKTGTSEPFERSRAIGETWAIGYTPQLVTGVWVGNADNSPIRNITSATVAARSWNEFMTAAHATLGLEPIPFKAPGGVVPGEARMPAASCSTSLDDDKPGTVSVPIKPPMFTDLFQAGNVEKYAHQFCRLFRIDKRTGLGVSPVTPLNQIEERLIPDVPEDARDWAREHGYALPPTDFAPAEKSAAERERGATPTPTPLPFFNPFAGTPTPTPRPNPFTSPP